MVRKISPAAARAGEPPDHRPPPSEPDGVARAAAHLQGGQAAQAAEALLPVLAARAAAGDRTCELAATLLRRPTTPDRGGPHPPPVPDDQFCRTVDHLLRLVQQQDAQLRSLHALLDTLL